MLMRLPHEARCGVVFTPCSLRSQCQEPVGPSGGGVGQKMGRVPLQRRKEAQKPTTTGTAVLLKSYWLELHGRLL